MAYCNNCGERLVEEAKFCGKCGFKVIGLNSSESEKVDSKKTLIGLYFNTFKKFVYFRGRANQREYWTFIIISLIIEFALGFVEGLLGVGTESSSGVFALLFQLIVFFPSLSVGVRRMHDVGKSGWCVLIPIYNLYLALKVGESGENKYGPKQNN